MTTACPDPDTLRGVLDSSLPERDQAEVVSHLDSCIDCQETLQQLAAAGSSVIELAHAAKTEERPTDGSAFWPALRRIEQEIKSPVLALSQTQADPEAPAPESSFAFLEPSEEPSHLGQIDRFQVVELVGRGGMGMVFRAYDACLQRTVAIKVLDPQYAKNELARGRFLREARAAAGVAHENVVIIHHVDCIEDRGTSYLVMQFVRGRSLQDRLDQGGPLPVREAVRIAAATASGLAAAHANGLIHRDVKPANILIEQASGRVLLTDFGLARLTEDVKLTQTGFVAGTPLYMSPEQAHGEEVDHRSDLFSLGSVLYAMLTGTPPFQGSSPFGVLKQVTDGRHRPVQEINRAVPGSVAEIVDRLLEKNPRYRYSNAADVAAALNAELAKLPAEATVTTVTRRTSRLLPAQVRSWWRRYSPVTLGALAVVLGLLLASEALGWTHWTVIGQRGRNTPGPATAGGAPGAPAVEEAETPPLYVLPHGDGAVWSVAFAPPPGNLIATASEGGTVKFWDAKTGTARGAVNAQNTVWAIAFNHDGSLLATATDDGFVRLWNVKAKEEVAPEFKHSFTVRCLAFSPDGRWLATGTRNGAVGVWNAETGRRVHAMTGHETGAVLALAFSPDGKTLASAGSDKTVRLWNMEDGGLQSTLSQPAGPVYTVAFHPHLPIVAAAGWDRTVRLWDSRTSAPLNVFEPRQDEIWSIAFSPDGRELFAAGLDRTARWFDAETGTLKKVFRGSSHAIHGIAVSPSGKMLAAGARDGTIRVWAIEP